MVEQMANPDAEEVLLPLPIGVVRLLIRYLERGVEASSWPEEEDRVIENLLDGLRKIVEASGDGIY